MCGIVVANAVLCGGEMFAGTLETLEIAGMLINFHSGKFGYSILHNFSKGHAEFFREIWHDLLKL